MSRDGAYWLGKRVRVGAGCSPETTMAEGVVIGYLSAPSVMVRDAEGRDSTWMVTLPIEVLGEVPDDELPMRAEPVDTGSRNLELRSQLYEWLGKYTGQASGAEHNHESLRRLAEQLAQLVEQLPTPMEGKLAEILRGAGIEYPLGLRGVRDLVNQRDGHRQRAEEAEDELRAAWEALPESVTGDGAPEHATLAERISAVVAERDQARQGMLAAASLRDKAERRLANVREMVKRLRNAAGGGVTPGYVLVRIEDMLNGEVPA